MQILPAALVLLSLSSCANIKPAATIKINNLDASARSVVIIDQRAETEKQSTTFSMNAHNCAFGIDRYGDETLQPDKLRLLKHRIHEHHHSSDSAPITVVVHNFVIYHNTQELSRSMGTIASLAGGGIVLVANPKSINALFGGSNRPGCEPRETSRAYYTKAEKPQSGAIFIAHLDAEINGKRKYVRVTHPYLNHFGSNRDDQIAVTEQAINKLLADW